MQNLSLENYTAEELLAYEKALATVDYSFYVEYVHKGLYEHGRHTQLVCDALDRVERGELKRLMIFMPPRHSKSMTVTETFPSYFIGKNPERRVIEVSYSGSLAKKFGRANKQKVAEFGADLFDIHLPRDNKSTTNWGVLGHRGGMISVGVGGAITGEGADLLLVDDPIKNQKEADSQVYRDNLWNEWKSTLRTRLQPNGAIIIILTRWHEDDLAGRILADPEEAEGWEIISLPALCEDPATDLLGRSFGETLNPERGFDEKWAVETKRAVGSRTWSSLYQQNPTPAEGQLLKRQWWKYYRALPNHFDIVIQSWDMAFKDSDESDYVVGQVWGMIGADKYLIDQVRGQMDLPTSIKAVENLSAKHPLARLKLIEDKANGTGVIQTLKKKVAGIVAVNPEGGKIARANGVSPDIEAGNVYIPDPSIAPWVNDFVEECAAFPNGKNDDQVDAMTQALIRLVKKAESHNPDTKPKGKERPKRKNTF